MTVRLLDVTSCLIVVFSLSTTFGDLPARENQNPGGIEAQVDEIFKECDRPGSPGAAVAILKNGGVLLCRGYGCAQLEFDIPITPDTVFWVASVSKQFTAMAITMLEEQQLLSTDDDIHKYLPEIPDFGAPITLRHLLHHTSGLRDDLTLWVLAGNHIEDVITQEDLLGLTLRQKQLNFSPGSRYGSADTNYALLAEVVSRVTGEPFASWVSSHILIPLEMKSSRFVTGHAEIVENRAYCYRTDDGGGFRNAFLSMGLVGPTGLLTTAEDMTKWLINFETRQVGGDSVFEAMLTPGVLDSEEKITYARGLTVDTYRGRKVIKHSGTDAGFNSHIAYFPDERLGVVVLSNFESSPWDLGDQVVDLFLQTESESPSGTDDKADQPPSTPEKQAFALTREQVDACAGSYWYEESYQWLVRDIIPEDGKLYYVRSADNRTELVPLSDHECLLAGTNETIVRFLDPRNGRFTGLAFDANSEDPSYAVRVDRFEPAEDELCDYEGLYYAEELDALHRLVAKPGGLHNIKFRYEPNTPWVPVVKDKFAFLDRYGHVSFQRDQSGKVIGYVINFPRAENIVFRRLN